MKLFIGQGAQGTECTVISNPGNSNTLTLDTAVTATDGESVYPDTITANEAGLWVLSTTTRGVYPPYPGPKTGFALPYGVGSWMMPANPTLPGFWNIAFQGTTPDSSPAVTDIIVSVDNPNNLVVGQVVNLTDMTGDNTTGSLTTEQGKIVSANTTTNITTVQIAPIAANLPPARHDLFLQVLDEPVPDN